MYVILHEHGLRWGLLFEIKIAASGGTQGFLINSKVSLWFANKTSSTNDTLASKKVYVQWKR